ncbi:hypothetical protein E3U23_10030 [Erythrobacter litoralis]|uniref:hypothetical protein n=1 Tax=Erythrobacter litoralis TaxID=39960 RepID=UPI00243598E7|nr:hypothetical protein [Erythrobacter litoralis]MDG6079532.1 hypothetical protein [Erythrobacter litoralis]
MPDDFGRSDPDDEDDVMAGDRRIARTDTALPDWYVSDAAYRPIPIAWFAGALVLQVILQPVLAIVTTGIGFSRWFAIGLCLLASGFIWHITMERGMARAALGWRIALALMLVFFTGVSVLGLLA